MNWATRKGPADTISSASERIGRPAAVNVAMIASGAHSATQLLAHTALCAGPKIVVLHSFLYSERAISEALDTNAADPASVEADCVAIGADLLNLVNDAEASVIHLSIGAFAPLPVPQTCDGADEPRCKR
jgi:hypothetical protein